MPLPSKQLPRSQSIVFVPAPPEGPANAASFYYETILEQWSGERFVSRRMAQEESGANASTQSEQHIVTS
jgi:hypothetical protein